MSDQTTPSLLRRGLAAGIDGLCLNLFVYGHRYFLDIIESRLPFGVYRFLYWAPLVLVFLAYAFLESRPLGAGPGKFLFKLQLIGRSGETLSLLRSFLRLLIKGPLALCTLGFSFWGALFSKDRLTFHDKILGTRVVLKP